MRSMIIQIFPSAQREGRFSGYLEVDGEMVSEVEDAASWRHAFASLEDDLAEQQ